MVIQERAPPPAAVRGPPTPMVPPPPTPPMAPPPPTPPMALPPPTPPMPPTTRAMPITTTPTLTMAVATAEVKGVADTSSPTSRSLACGTPAASARRASLPVFHSRFRGAIISWFPPALAPCNSSSRTSLLHHIPVATGNLIGSVFTPPGLGLPGLGERDRERGSWAWTPIWPRAERASSKLWITHVNTLLMSCRGHIKPGVGVAWGFFLFFFLDLFAPWGKK